jgi:diketogulonate reductase-like aldo/keto reductase
MDQAMKSPQSAIPRKALESGFEMPALGYGTWTIGGTRERDPNNDDEGDIRVIRMAIDLGLTHVDTAERYAGGHAEELIGEAIRPYARESLFLTTKAHRDHLKPDDLKRACEASLKRLGVSYLDLYLAHAYNPAIPLGETVRAMDGLVDAGLVRAIGVSNFNKEHLAHALAFSNHGIACDQVHYSLITREPETDGLLGYCQENDVMLVAYRPVEKGRIGGDPAVMRELCEKYGKTPAQVAINWLVSQENVAAITMSRSPEHLKENLGGLGWRMTDLDIERLRREFPDTREKSTITPLG